MTEITAIIGRIARSRPKMFGNDLLIKALPNQALCIVIFFLVRLYRAVLMPDPSLSFANGVQNSL